MNKLRNAVSKEELERKRILKENIIGWSLTIPVMLAGCWYFVYQLEHAF